jgi:hypothetical protein
MGVLVASGDRFRLPVAFAAIEPERQGPQPILCRQMRKAFEPPAWGREVVVVAEASDPANATRTLSEERQWSDVFARPRPRKFSDGRYVRDLGQHLPTAQYRSRATSKPDGRRHDSWGCLRHATLPQRGDGTSVRSQKRRHEGPQRVKIMVTKLREARASAILRQYAVRWGVDLTRKERKGGLQVGRMQVSQEAERVERSIMLPGCASLLLVHLYGTEQGERPEGSLLHRTQCGMEACMQDQGNRVAQKWLRKWHKIKQAA